MHIYYISCICCLPWETWFFSTVRNMKRKKVCLTSCSVSLGFHNVYNHIYISWPLSITWHCWVCGSWKEVLDRGFYDQNIAKNIIQIMFCKNKCIFSLPSLFEMELPKIRWRWRVTRSRSPVILKSARAQADPHLLYFYDWANKITKTRLMLSHSFCIFIIKKIRLNYKPSFPFSHTFCLFQFGAL